MLMMVIYMGKNINTIKKNTDALLDTSNEVGLEMNKENTKCMFMSYHQNAGQNQNIKIAHRFYENMAKLKYL
jgi:hypothetical protein